MKRLIILTFILCFTYWTYLFINTQPSIVFDAEGYSTEGHYIAEHGFRSYLSQSLQREPLYPLTIAASVKIGSLLNTNYINVLKVIQILCLFITILVIYYLMVVCGVNDSVKALAVFYLGFSPSLVNATFSMYSEIIAFPFVPLIILVAERSLYAIYDEYGRKVTQNALLIAFVFLLASFSKSVFIVMFPLFLLSFLFVGRDKLRKSVKFIIIAFLTFSVVIVGYMSLNKSLNGNFKFTTRFDDALFGVTYKRSEKINSRIFLAHVATIPGTGICRRYFTKEECDYCQHYSTTYHSSITLPKLREKTGDSILMLTVKTWLSNPKQQTMYYLMETPKLFFWESTRIGYVQYPKWLASLYEWTPFRMGIRLFLSILTIWAFFTIRTHNPVGFYTFILICTSLFAYSFYYILTRYALPMASLYVFLIAKGLDDQRWID